MATSDVGSSPNPVPRVEKVTRNVSTFVKSFYTHRRTPRDEASTMALCYGFEDLPSEESAGTDSDDSEEERTIQIKPTMCVPASNWGGNRHIQAEKKRNPKMYSSVNRAAEMYALKHLGLLKDAKTTESKEDQEGRLKFENTLKLFQGPAKKLDVTAPWLENGTGKMKPGQEVDKSEVERAQDMMKANDGLELTYQLPEEESVGGEKEEAVDTTPPYLVLPEISPIVHAMLFQGYMSTGRFPFLDYSMSWDLLKLAKIYNYPDSVLDKIRTYLFLEAWEGDNCWVAYQEACNQGEHRLKDVALWTLQSDYFNKCADDFEFLYLEPEQLVSLVQLDTDIWEEPLIFNNCIAWARNRAARTIPGTDKVEAIIYPTFPLINQCEPDEKGMIHDHPPETPVDHKLVRKYMKPLLPHFRFFSIPSPVLKVLLQSSKIFRLSEIEMLCNPDSDNPKTKEFRDFFCQLTTPRSKVPYLEQLYLYGFSERVKINQYSRMAYAPYYMWSCPILMYQLRRRNVSHVTVHVNTRMKTEDDTEDSYQEKFTLVLCTPGQEREVRYVSGNYDVKAIFNYTVEVQFKLPEMWEVPEFHVELFVVRHCSGLYRVVNPWITDGESNNESCNII